MIRFLTPEYVREKFDTRKFSDGSAGNALIINEKIWDEGRKLLDIANSQIYCQYEVDSTN